MSSTTQSMADMLARLAPVMDPHLLLHMLEFYQQKGVDVAAARAALLKKTKLPEAMSEDSSRSLDERFKKALNAANALLVKYFNQTADGDAQCVLKVSEQELSEKKSSTGELSIRTFEGVSAEIVEEEIDGVVMKADALKQIKAKYVSSASHQVTITEGTSASGAPVWRIAIRDARGEIPESNAIGLLEVATLCYETGRYQDANEIFTLLRFIFDGNNSLTDKFHSVLWGLVATTILTKRPASNALRLIRIHVLGDETDETKEDAAPVLGADEASAIHRSFAMHWSLFHYFKGGESLSEGFLDHVFREFGSNPRDRQAPNQRAVELVAPHLLRYIAAACLLNRSKRAALYSTLRLSRMCYEFTDVFLTFVEQLIGQVNFDAAFALLPQLAETIEGDYFLAGLKTHIMDSANKLIFEQYLRTHKTVSIATVAKRLFPELDPESEVAKAKAELWIANLIRESKVVAKIDSVGGKIDVSGNQSTFEKRMFDKLNFAQRAAYH
eukprot:CAMPEP_0176432624 /NCGR_PEP_ID=MMETSP0127-20121128/15501_1 /TAXON_ID=938130 /ORGANISM="Platyophrya macrostoma, Strain WH" /LENGTH=498 /DNA_ID=CAMNT_0017814823 /DNA_START=29 /DNA_END=1525 /DNA_ORIENTATION=-